jgi:L-amino acid N-acyltransferase YncA
MHSRPRTIPPSWERCPDLAGKICPDLSRTGRDFCYHPAVRARPATPADAEAVARIYNAGIEERIATFETRRHRPEEMLPELGGAYPAVVVVSGGAVIAFATTSAYSPRDCYSGIAEFSVYTDAKERGRGAGRLAMEALIREAEHRGFWKLLAKVFVENVPSRKLLHSLGFREVGVHERHARLDNTWRDVVVVEVLLQKNL